MRFAQHLVMTALLAPTAGVLAAVVISLTAPVDAPAKAGVNPTSLAVYYADLEKQP